MYREHLKCVFISCLLGAADPATSSSSSSSSFVNGATSKNLPAVQTVGPMPEDTMENMRWGSVHSMDHTLRLQEHNLILSRYGLVFFAISNGLQNTSPLYLPHTFPVHSLQSYLFTTETYNGNDVNNYSEPALHYNMCKTSATEMEMVNWSRCTFANRRLLCSIYDREAVEA